MGRFWIGEARNERSDAVENRRRVLSAARRLFAERGVTAVSMHEIGRFAGVGQGTLYRRYRNKGELCAALLADEIQDFEAEVRARVEGGVEGGEEPALDSLWWFLGRLAEFNEENWPLLGAMRESRSGGREVEMRRNPFYEHLRETVAELLGRAMEEGVRRDLDIEVLTDSLLAPLDIDLWLYQRQRRGLEPGRIVAALRGLYSHGLKDP